MLLKYYIFLFLNYCHSLGLFDSALNKKRNWHALDTRCNIAIALKDGVFYLATRM